MATVTITLENLPEQIFKSVPGGMFVIKKRLIDIPSKDAPEHIILDASKLPAQIIARIFSENPITPRSKGGRLPLKEVYEPSTTTKEQ
jgi:hypothetical protein